MAEAVARSAEAAQKHLVVYEHRNARYDGTDESHGDRHPCPPIPSDRDTCAVGILLFGPVVNKDAGISFFSPFRYVCLFDEKYHVGAFITAFSLSKRIDFLCKTLYPHFFILVHFDKLTVLQSLSSVRIDNGVGLEKVRITHQFFPHFIGAKFFQSLCICVR